MTDLLNRGSGPNIHAGADSWYVATGKINDFAASQLALNSRTISAGDIRFILGATTEARIDLALAQAMSELAGVLYIPTYMLPFDVTLLTNLAAFHALGGRLTREGGDPSVRDLWAYGATHNGIADDRPAFAALAAGLAAAGGGVAQMPGGTYAVGGNNIFWPSHTVVRGAGRGVTILKRIGLSDSTPDNRGALFGTGPSDGTFYSSGAHGQFVAFEDFTIDGNYLANAGLTSTLPHADGIRADSTDDVVIRRVSIKDCMNSGVYFYRCRRTLCDNVIVETCGHLAAASSRNGFTITGPSDAATDQGSQDEHTLSKCYSIGNTDEGIAFGRVGLVTISESYFLNNGDAGIEGDIGTASSDTTSVPAGVIITSTYVANNGGNGIGVNNGNVQQVVIGDCIVLNSGKSGITTDFTSGSLLKVTGTIISGFATVGATHHGVTVGDFDAVVIGDNLVANGDAAGGSGISLVSSASLRTGSITGNTVVSVLGGSGIYVIGTFRGTISGNTTALCGPASGAGINLEAQGNILDQITVTGNQSFNNGVRGILVRANGAGNVANLRFSNNTCTDNQGVKTQDFGIVFLVSSGAITGITLDGNDLEGNSNNHQSGLTDAMLSSISIPRRTQPIAFNASITPDALAGEDIEVGALTANITAVNAPTNAFKGLRLRFRFLQDGTGGRTVGGWNAVFKQAWSDTGNTLSKQSMITYRYDGTNWVQESAQGPYV